jgi:hypothetical protein
MVCHDQSIVEPSAIIRNLRLLRVVDPFVIYDVFELILSHRDVNLAPKKPFFLEFS